VPGADTGGRMGARAPIFFANPKKTDRVSSLAGGNFYKCYFWLSDARKAHLRSFFLCLKMLNSAPKLHKLMPEIPYVRFYCGNSDIRDLLQILATEIQTNFNNSPRQNVPKL
jgi:hypothetical protein